MCKSRDPFFSVFFFFSVLSVFYSLLFFRLIIYTWYIGAFVRARWRGTLCNTHCARYNESSSILYIDIYKVHWTISHEEHPISQNGLIVILVQSWTWHRFQVAWTNFRLPKHSFRNDIWLLNASLFQFLPILYNFLKIQNQLK